MKKNAPGAQGEVPPLELLKFLNDIAPELRCPLSLDEVAAAIEERLGPVRDLDLVASALSRSPAFALTHRSRFVTRQVLLHKAFVRIEPTAEEIARGVLLAGHRLVPLWSGREVAGIAAAGEDGRPLRSTKAELTLTQAAPYHRLLGFNWIPELSRDQKGTASFAAFDLGAFYARAEFRPGDFIIAEIADAWRKEIVLRPEHRAAAVRHLAAIRASDMELEKAFIAILEEPHILWSLPEQLFHALAAAAPVVLRSPGSTFDRFVAHTPSIATHEVGLELAAFPRNMSPFELAVRRTIQEKGKPDLFAHPLDQLLTRMGINLHSASLRGLLRLAAADRTTLRAAADKVIPWNRMRHGPIDDVRAFKAHLRRMWYEALREEEREPLDGQVAALLRRAAGLKERVLQILRQLDHLGLRAEELPARPLLRIVEIDELAECILQLDVATDDSRERAADLEGLIADVEQHLRRLQKEILNEAFVL